MQQQRLKNQIELAGLVLVLVAVWCVTILLAAVCWRLVAGIV